jgi:uncharacterized damage-inducible protein DinB
MPISSAVKEAWEINSQINQSVLRHLSPEMLSAKTPGGGFSVAEHLVEILYTPKYFGLKFAPEHLQTLPNLFEAEGDTFVVESDLEKFRDAAPIVAESVLKAAEAAVDKGDLPHTDLDTYLIHMMVHDAHHRGQLFLALKTNGYPLPDDALIWNPWKVDRSTAVRDEAT